jgi:hypothetical protein
VLALIFFVSSRDIKPLVSTILITISSINKKRERERERERQNLNLNHGRGVRGETLFPIRGPADKWSADECKN